MHHVIIGAGPAGVIAAETLRDLDAQAEITIVSDEPEPPYSRMAIPYYLIDNIPEAGTYLRKTPEHFGARRIQIVRDRVQSVSTANTSLALAGGDTLGYDRLLVATGSHPLKPPIEGIDLPGVHPCWTLEDARAIVALAQPGAKVVLMGAGFIGSIILEALSTRGVELTVVEMGNRMVPRMMNERSGALIQRWCESKGVKVLTSRRAAGIERGAGGHALGMSLEGGDGIAADLIISATGVSPNVAFLDGTGVEVDAGIVVNEHLRSSVPGIFAAGDVAQGKDFSTGGYSVQAVQPTAVEHGRIAAANMASEGAVTHQGCVNMNILDTIGLVSSSFGLWQGVEGGDATELNDDARYRHVNLQFEDDVLVGANCVGMTDHIGVLRGLIQTRVHLGPWKDRLMRNPVDVMSAYVGLTRTMNLAS